jgi:hypothetical protein
MKRLIEGDADDFAQTVLLSARGDVPSDAARDRTALALGLGLGVGVAAAASATIATIGVGTTASAAVTSATTAATGAGVGAAGTSAAIGAGTTTLGGVAMGLGGATLTVKAAIALLAVGVLATGALALPPARHASHVGSVPTAIPSPVTAAVAPTAIGSHVAAPIARPQVEPRADAPPTPAAPIIAAPIITAPREVMTAHTASPTRPPIVTRTTADDLAHAMSILEAARTALDAGAPAKALSLVDDYEREFPNGSLLPEATVLRIEALVASGADRDALRVADRFLAASPDSPHARHVRAIEASIRGRVPNP